MRIHTLVWNAGNVEHLAVHHVRPEEVEEICWAQPLIFTAPSKGEHPVYYVLGQTSAGRYLFAVVIYFGQGKGYAITGRDMTDPERRRFSRWKNT